MIFSPHSIEQILAGNKFVTRRRVRAGEPCRYQVGKSYAIQPGRGKAAVGRVMVKSVVKERFVGAMCCDEAQHHTATTAFFIQKRNEYLQAEALREGFASWAELEAAYQQLNGLVSLERHCWRIEFKLEGD